MSGVTVPTLVFACLRRVVAKNIAQNSRVQLFARSAAGGGSYTCTTPAQHAGPVTRTQKNQVRVSYMSACTQFLRYSAVPARAVSILLKRRTSIQSAAREPCDESDKWPCDQDFGSASSAVAWVLHPPLLWVDAAVPYGVYHTPWPDFQSADTPQRARFQR